MGPCEQLLGLPFARDTDCQSIWGTGVKVDNVGANVGGDQT